MIITPYAATMFSLALAVISVTAAVWLTARNRRAVEVLAERAERALAEVNNAASRATTAATVAQNCAAHARHQHSMARRARTDARELRDKAARLAGPAPAVLPFKADETWDGTSDGTGVDIEPFN